jgi:hypothetical protein
MQAPAVVDCKSCGEQNAADMAFCLHCGKVMSSSVQAQRDMQGIKKRQCKSCGRADELNNRYCIFCGADIKAFIAKASNPEALARFTTDLAQFEPEPAEALKPTPVAAPAPTVYKPTAAKHSYSAFALPGFILLGALAGAGLAYFFKGGLVDALTFITGGSERDGLIIYTKQPKVNVVIESNDRKRYTIGQTTRGALAVSELEPGFHRIKMAVPGSEPIVETVELAKNKLNLLGYEQKVDASVKR